MAAGRATSELALLPLSPMILCHKKKSTQGKVTHEVYSHEVYWCFLEVWAVATTLILSSYFVLDTIRWNSNLNWKRKADPVFVPRVLKPLSQKGVPTNVGSSWLSCLRLTWLSNPLRHHWVSKGYRIDFVDIQWGTGWDTPTSETISPGQDKPVRSLRRNLDNRCCQFGDHPCSGGLPRRTYPRVEFGRQPDCKAHNDIIIHIFLCLKHSLDCQWETRGYLKDFIDDILLSYGDGYHTHRVKLSIRWYTTALSIRGSPITWRVIPIPAAQHRSRASLTRLTIPIMNMILISSYSVRFGY